MDSDRDDFREIEELFAELSAEIDLVAKVLPGNPWTRKTYADPASLSLVERRLLIRSVFSFIEAVVFTIKAGALISDTNRLSPAEIALAKEEDYELTDTGAVKTRKARLRFLSNVRFAFAVAAKAAEVDYHIDVGGEGWQALRNAIPVRDRLTHPKRAVDLAVTDEEVRNAMAAYHWVLEQWEHLAVRTLLQRN